MKRIRLQFSKSKTLTYIGHLDFLRVFQQTIRRAKLPVAYSEGFNPHIQLSFALPLPLGMIGANDFVDIILTKEIPLDEVVIRMNHTAPAGLTVYKAFPVSDKAASVVVAADYEVDCNIPAGKYTVEGLLAATSVIIAKKTKNGIKDTDIRPYIYDLRLTKYTLYMRLSAGSSTFVNPLIVAELILGYKTTDIIRTELYKKGDNAELISLLYV